MPKEALQWQVLGQRRDNADHVRPLVGLDFDDLRSHVAKGLAQARGRPDPAEVDDTQPFEGVLVWQGW